MFRIIGQSLRRGTLTERQPFVVRPSFGFPAIDFGRCTACEGQGVQIIDMQFLADISITCPECSGRRFGKEILDVKYRGKSIAEAEDKVIEKWMPEELMAMAKRKVGG